MGLYENNVAFAEITPRYNFQKVLMSIGKRELFITILMAGLYGLAISYGNIIHIIFLCLPFISLFFIEFIIKDAIRNSVLLFVIIYPILPFHVGVDFGGGLPVLKLQRVIVFCIICFWLIDRFLLHHSQAVSFLKFPLIKQAAFMLLILFICVFASGLNPEAIKYLLSFSIESILLMYVVYDLFKNETEHRRLIIAITISGGIVLLIGTIEHITGQNYYSKFGTFREDMAFAVNQQFRLGLNRVRGAFPHAIDFGAALVIISSLLFIISGFVYRYFLRKLLLCLYICGLVGCYLSYSRGPMIMWIVIFLFFLFREKNVKFFLSLLVCAVLFVSGPENLPFQNVFSASISAKTGMGSSAFARIEQIRQAIPFISLKPFTGWGFERTSAYLSRTIDNYYLRMLLNFGILGLFSFLFFYGLLLKKAFLIIRSDIGHRNFHSTFSYYYIAVSCSIFILFMTVSLEHYMYLYWVLSGILLRISTLDINSHDR
nr:O-antigen ligase family protein [uncultured Desulfobacter sp.]